jgi:hypothetical protein
VKLFCVLIHSDPNLRQLLGDMLEAWTAFEIRVDRSDFEGRLSGAWKSWLEQADIFVLGLDRRYDVGLRAEGVAVAESLFKMRKKALVVGSEANADKLKLGFYWDLASEQFFLETLREGLNKPIPSVEDRRKFIRFFEGRLVKPRGH